MGTQKNRLSETVLLRTQNICSKLQVRKYLQLYAENFCLPKPVYLYRGPDQFNFTCLLFVQFCMAFVLLIVFLFIDQLCVCSGWGIYNNIGPVKQKILV